MSKQRGYWFMREMESAFYRVARKAIEEGLLTRAERDTISRRKTSKQGNWLRHLRNLCDYIEYKQERV